MQEQSQVLIGESFVGEGAEAAHINIVLGDRDGPAGTPKVADVRAARHAPANPCFTPA